MKLAQTMSTTAMSDGQRRQIEKGQWHMNFWNCPTRLHQQMLKIWAITSSYLCIILQTGCFIIGGSMHLLQLPLIDHLTTLIMQSMSKYLAQGQKHYTMVPCKT